MSETERPPRRIRTRRHGVIVRITHWINVVCMAVLLMSGLQIFNAHPSLYWGSTSTFSAPFAELGYKQGDNSSLKGVTSVAGLSVDTTGVLGASRENGQLVARGFPSWATLPSYQDLATGRRWHFLFAWLFVINGLVYVLTALLGGGWRRMVPTRAQLRDFGGSLREHLTLHFPKGWEATRYNVIQKISYLLLIVVALPVMILAGLTMSPGVDSAFPFLLTLFGGRQSARTIHFILAFSFVLFTLVHVVMVLVSGVLNNMRSMITGTFVIEDKGGLDGRAD